MIQKNRSELRYIINEQFNNGINKENLFDAMENFIDKHYPPDEVKLLAESLNHKNIIRSFVHDVRKAGGYRNWKKSLLNE